MKKTFSKNKPFSIWFSVLAASALLAWCPAQAQQGWAGDYEGDSDISVKLTQAAGGNVQGSMVINGTKYALSLSGSDQKLTGTFSSSSGSFPVSLGKAGDGSVLLESDGNSFQLRRVGGANPLGAVKSPANPLAAAPRNDATATFVTSDGLFALSIDRSWNKFQGDDGISAIETADGEDGFLVFSANLDQEQANAELPRLVAMAHSMTDDLLLQMTDVQPVGQNIDMDPVSISGMDDAAISTKAGRVDGEEGTIWQGTARSGRDVFIIVTAVESADVKAFFPVAERVFATLKKGGTATPASRTTNPSGRHVVFNGVRLSDDELNRLEGGVPMIPDGNFWYDDQSGMAGIVGGPTEAYLATGLRLGGKLDANASGGSTNVAFNGRYLHPIDLAGLQMYFGEINPGRYWIDGQGNYGLENQGKMGNLVEEIALVQLYASQLQAMYQQQLQQEVQQYSGQQGGGYYGQGGGYQSGGGESVYSHFPNLGSSGTGVSVGGGIVNAGGVMWWPGK